MKNYSNICKLLIDMHTEIDALLLRSSWAEDIDEACLLSSHAVEKYELLEQFQEQLTNF